MVYAITPEDTKKIDDVDVAFGTTKLLPKMEDIPKEFIINGGNEYTKLAEKVFYGSPLSGSILFRDGFDQKLFVRTVRAHLASFEPKHEHKIAGVGYMISKMATITP